MQLQILNHTDGARSASPNRTGAVVDMQARAQGGGTDTASGRETVAMGGLVAVLLFIAGLAASGSPSIVPYVFMALSAMVAISILCFLAFCAPALASFNARHSSNELEERIETLEDLRWQARDTADHLQALLDNQPDIIIIRDARGHITFANRAFCSLFDVGLTEVLGAPFHPKIVSRDACAAPDQARRANMPTWALPQLEEIATVDGPRWIEWSHRRLDNPQSGAVDIQSIGHDITDQRRHERQLARARDQARAADRAKSRFLASMSHEIRTPMNGILGMAGLLNETALSAEQRTYTEAVRSSAKTLLELIDEILDFSKIEAGHVDLASEPVDVVGCVQGIVELLAPRAFQKNLQMAWSVAPNIAHRFLGDETRLRQILLNLLGNAVKFTDTGGISVWVGAEPRDDVSDLINIVIRDTGPGLSDEARARIFMEFERAVVEGAPSEGGTGLGLAIAQRLAQSMGGCISVKSAPGEGATFTLSIHLRRAQPSLQRPVSDRLARRHVVIVSPQAIERRTVANFLRAHDMAVTEMSGLDASATQPLVYDGVRPDTVLFDISTDRHAARQFVDALSAAGPVDTAVIAAASDRPEFDRFHAAGIANYLVRPIRPATLLALLAGELEQPATPDATPALVQADAARALGWRVLVAEDNEINALLTRTVVGKLGCEAIVVPNGRDAVAEVARALAGDAPRIDAILMDLHMPMVDGLAATAEIQQLCDAANAPRPVIIAVTANAFAEDRERCLAAGMDDYLSKPFEPCDLRRVLEGLATSAGA